MHLGIKASRKLERNSNRKPSEPNKEYLSMTYCI